MILLPLILTSGAALDVSFVRTSLPAGEALLAWHAEDLDGDQVPELLLVSRAESQRVLGIHRIEDSRVAATPFFQLDLFPEVTGVGVGELRAEDAGKEILLLSAKGAYSLTWRKQELRGNITPLVKEELLHDFARREAIGWWTYFLERPTGIEGLLLPMADGLGTLQGSGTDARLVPFEGQSPRSSSSTEPGALAASAAGSVEVQVQVSGGKLKRPFVGELSDRTSTVARDSRSYDAPLLIDLDADGFEDLVWIEDAALRIHAGGSKGPSVAPTQRVPFPDYLQEKARGEAPLTLWFERIDGDARPDILARIGDSTRSGFENDKQRLLVLRQGREGLFPSKPHQVLSFEAADLRPELADLDGDGKLDLVVRQFRLPDFTDLLTGLEFEMTVLWYRGTGRGFETKPTLRESRIFTEEQMDALIARRTLTHDLSGDGLADQVEVDLQGRLTIRRLEKESGFFSGTSWSLESAPWKQFETTGALGQYEVLDLNGDGVGDLVCPGEHELLVFLSQGGR